MPMPYIIIADVKYYENGPSVQSYLNIQEEGVFWDDESMEIWDEYYRAASYAKDIRNNKITLSRNFAEVENIRVGRAQIMETGLDTL
jgi:hypothetical protein